MSARPVTARPPKRWNYGDLLDAVDAVFPADAPALIHGERTVPWADFAARSNALARAFQELGAAPGDKVAFYQRNRTEYMETLAACLKGRLVHVNVNFRYRDDELHYILENSDAKLVVYSAEFADAVARLRDRLPGVAAFVQVGGDTLPDFAIGFETLIEGREAGPLDIERSEEDLLFIYTGGTTGLPKAVMWDQGGLWGALGYGANATPNAGERPETPAQHVENVRAFGPGIVQIPCCPLMHGTGLLTAINTISAGGCIVTLESPGFDAEELWNTVERSRANSTVIVGDAFAKPMLKALDEHPGRWDLSSLRVIMSSGVMWSLEVKQGLLRHHPDLMLVDAFGSSEAIGFGTSITTAGGESRTARFQIGESCKVFTEDHREVAPGSGEKGFIARRGPIPRGYFKDPEKSAETFPTIDGVRYSIPGDWCTVEADGTLTLLGRGSVCINSAGEKIHPEEVEECLKTHPDVEDALVLGVPDERWGQAVTGVVQLRAGTELDEDGLRAHVRDQLAGYKTPKRVLAVERMFRAPNGKADYRSAEAHARQELGFGLR